MSGNHNLVVICDIDGVLADFIHGFTTLAQTIYNHVPITLTSKQPRWDGFPGMTQEEIDHTWSKVYKSTTFWRQLRPLAKEQEFQILRLLNDDVDLYFATARVGWSVIYQTKHWIHEHVGIDAPNILITHRKGEAARTLDADYMLDDKAGNAVYAAYHADKKLHSYIIDRPYNKFNAEVIGSSVKRVFSLGEYIEAVWKNI